MRTGDFVHAPGTTENAHLVAFHEEMADTFITNPSLNSYLNDQAMRMSDALGQVWFPDTVLNNETSASIFRSLKTLLWDYTDPSEYEDQPTNRDIGLLLSTLFHVAGEQADDFAALLEAYTYQSHAGLNRLNRVLSRIAGESKLTNAQRFLAVYGMVFGAAPDVPPQSRR